MCNQSTVGSYNPTNPDLIWVSIWSTQLMIVCPLQSTWRLYLSVAASGDQGCYYAKTTNSLDLRRRVSERRWHTIVTRQ